MPRLAPPLTLLVALIAAAPASGAVALGTYTGTVEGTERTATITRSTCVVPRSLRTDEPRSRRGLCFSFTPSTVYIDVRCVNDGEVETIRIPIVDGLRVPRSGRIDVTRRTVGQIPGVERRSVARRTLRLNVGLRRITGSFSFSLDRHNLVGHTECAGRVRFTLKRT